MGTRCRRGRGPVVAAVAAGLLMAGMAVADEAAEARNRVNFRVEVARMVDNDRLEAVLVASAEESDPARCAEKVNAAMQWAIAETRGVESVEVETRSYSTQPVYEDGRIRRWRARQELALASGDSEAVVELVTRLQERLALQSFRFELSAEQRRKTEEALIEEALSGFRARAELIRRSLDAGGWRLDELSIDTNRGILHRPQREALVRATSLASAPVQAEAGTSEVTIHVQASIVLE